jgi:NAD/NADP transhydrogenase beta subunit
MPSQQPGTTFWFEDWATAKTSLYLGAYLLAILLFVLSINTFVRTPKAGVFGTFAGGFAMIVLIITAYLLQNYLFAEFMKVTVSLILGGCIGLTLSYLVPNI